MADKALMVGAFGGRGTGKTTWVKWWLKTSKSKRVVIWDYKHDPKLEGFGVAYQTLGEVIKAMKAKTFCIRYLVEREKKHEMFDLFCKACWHASNLTMFVDELPEVTRANKAPEAWRTCVNVGREYKLDGKDCALTIVIAAQRPAECDKSTIGNCDVIHSGRVRGNDADVLAVELGCKADDLVKLPDFHFLEIGPGDMGVPRRGEMTLTRPIEKKVSPDTRKSNPP